jgi:APA family basic amino acid/polyamine antiporter/L-type amino acid transporter 9
VPLYPIVPAVFILAALFLLGSSVVDESSRWGTLGVFGAILLGVPIYYLFVARGHRGGP